MIQVKLAPKHYFVELIGAMALFMAALLERRALLGVAPDIAWLKVTITLCPLVGVYLAAWAIYRLYARTDEMLRKAMLENIAFAALFCALASMTLGFMHDVGFSRINIGWAWPLMGIGWLLICAWRGAKWAIAERGFVRFAKILLLVLATVGIPTAIYALVAPGLGWSTRPGMLVLVATGFFLVIAGYQTFRNELNE